MKEIIKLDRIEELFDLMDKIVVITGAGGIGEVAAKAFAKNGATVILMDIKEDDAKRVKDDIIKLGFKADAYKLDVTIKEEVDAVINEVVNKYGVIDILIHTAGIAINETALDFTEENIHKVIDINLKGTIFLNQSVGKVMAKQGKGKIINIGSIGGYMCHMRESMPYEASKAGVHQLTRTFAADLALYGINVNSIAPTWVNTKMCAGKPDAYYDNVNKATPFGRFLEPEELVGAMIFLSTDASNFVTGQVIFVDGGWSTEKALDY